LENYLPEDENDGENSIVPSIMTQILSPRTLELKETGGHVYAAAKNILGVGKGSVYDRTQA